MRSDPMDGELCLLVNIKRTECKVSLWDGTGLSIFMRRLEPGRFVHRSSENSGAAMRLTSSELALFIEGCALVGKRMLSPRELMRTDPCLLRQSATL